MINSSPDQPASKNMQESNQTQHSTFVQEILSPGANEQLVSSTFRQITKRLLPTIVGYEGITPEQISAMTPEDIALAVSKINEIYAFRGIVVSIKGKAIPFLDANNNLHSIKSIDDILAIGDENRESNSTFVSGYAFGGERYEPNEYIRGEIENFHISMSDITREDYSFEQEIPSVRPAILVYRKANLEPKPGFGGHHRFEYTFKTFPNSANPKRDALVGLFIVPQPEQ